MTRQIFASALFAGLTAGLIAALLQALFLVPVIHEAERYETGELTHFAGLAAEADHDHDHAAPGDGHSHAPPEAGAGFDLARTALTVAMDVVVYTGFALVLVAALAFAASRGMQIDLRRGLLFGLAGFAAVQLAPALGLPPELPGTPAADLALRQLWWTGCVAATAVGLALLVFIPGPLRLAGLLLIALPHLLGAPAPEGFAGIVPPELAGLFAARALATGAIAWAVLGAATGYFWTRTA
jgi:cobalt transporter subunit CbtA